MTALVKVTSDGRLYPPSWPHMPPAERQRLRALAHDLHCRQGLSIRATQRAMLERFGERRSVGQIHKDLTWECPYCSTAPRPPDPAQRVQVHAWR